MTVEAAAKIYRASKGLLLRSATSALFAALGAIAVGRHAEPYTAAVFYVMAGALVLLAASFLPSLIWPATLRLSPEGIVWKSSLGLKTRFSARWADLDGVGLHRPQPIVTIPLGEAKERPVAIGFRFKNGRLPLELKQKGAGAINFGQWAWVIPSTWDAPAEAIVAECERRLS